MVTCILLTGGLSQRFGSPKALARFNGETIVERLQNLLLRTQVHEIITVLGAQAKLIKPYLLKHKCVKFVYNKDYNLGQTSSFKVGLQSVSKKVHGFLLLPVDYPFITEDTINRLTDFYKENNPLILIPSFEGQKGHPPLFSNRLRDEFLTLDNNCGLYSVAHTHPSETKILTVTDRGVIQTFNTQEEFEALKRYYK
jgi:CTP:molybdopterin cytidylyltransferase MocA